MHTTFTQSGDATQGNSFASQPFQLNKQALKKQSFKKYGAIIAVVICLGGCGTMTNRGKSTAIGAGVGAVAGAVLTGGSAWGTVGGAAVGGVVGNQIGK